VSLLDVLSLLALVAFGVFTALRPLPIPRALAAVCLAIWGAAVIKSCAFRGTGEKIASPYWTQVLTDIEMYGVALGFVWAGSALWRRQRRNAAILIWASGVVAFFLAGLGFGCWNDGDGCM
jgi:hypothetical protein